MSLSHQHAELHYTVQDAGRLNRQISQNTFSKDRRATQAQKKRGIKGNDTHESNTRNGNVGKGLPSAKGFRGGRGGKANRGKGKNARSLLEMKENNNIRNYFVPTEILCQIFSKFLSIQDVSQFDTAMCNKAKRSVYLEFIGSKECLWLGDKETGLHPHRISWISKRRMNIAHLKCCRASNSMAINFDTFGSSLQWLSLYDENEDEQCSLLSDKGVIRIIEGCPNLQYLDMECCQFITDSISAPLAKFCPDLKDLDLSYCYDISDIGIMNTVEGCNMQDLNLTHCSRITDTSVIRIANCCVNLRFLNLTSCYEITDSCIVSIAKRCHSLDTLILSQCDKISDVSEITHSCPNLQLLDLSMCDDITESCLIKISEWCHNLQSLDVSGCNNVTVTIIRRIAVGCPNLQNLTMYECLQLDGMDKFKIETDYPNLKSSSKWEDMAVELEDSSDGDEYDEMMFDQLYNHGYHSG